MEACVPSNTLAPQDKSNSSGSATAPCYPDHNGSSAFSVNDLETRLNEFLNIEGNKLATSSFYQFFDKNGVETVAKEDNQDDLEKKNPGGSASEKSLIKSARFPLLGDLKSSVDGALVGKGKKENVVTAEASEANGCGKAINQYYSRSISLPKSSEIVSAMKGSRENQGIEPKKLSVTWASDVYDPVPTAASHVPSNKNQRYRKDGKKYGKNKLKGGGKSSRGSKGKDKKQVCKNNGFNKVKPIHDNGFGFSKPAMGIEILMSGVHTPFCGSSFLKKSVTKLQFPVTEAT